MIFDEENEIIKLEGNDYHIHLKDLKEGKILIELNLLFNLCKILKVNYDDLEPEQFMKSLNLINKEINNAIKIIEGVNE